MDSYSVFPVSDDVVRISAQNNWWGYNDTWAVMGRIWDGRDEPGLAVVVYEPYYKHNYTLLSGP